MDSALVLSALLLQAGAGGSLLASLLPYWRGIRPGFRVLLGVVASALFLAGGVGLASPLAALGAVPALVGGFPLGRREGPGRAAFGLSGIAGLLSLGSLAGARGLLAGAAGAWVLGAVLDGLLLGHWYIFDRGAPTLPLQRTAEVLLAGSLAGVVGAVSGGGGVRGEGLSPLLYVGEVRTWIALGLLAAVGLLAVLLRALAREGSTRSATGFFYLALLLAFPAELAAALGSFSGRS